MNLFCDFQTVAVCETRAMKSQINKQNALDAWPPGGEKNIGEAKMFLERWPFLWNLLCRINKPSYLVLTAQLLKKVYALIVARKTGFTLVVRDGDVTNGQKLHHRMRFSAPFPILSKIFL